MVTRNDLHNRLHGLGANLSMFRVSVYEIVLTDVLPYAVPINYPQFWVERGPWLITDPGPSPDGPSRVYDPMEEMGPFLTAATAVDTRDDEDILRFVNYWGLLIEQTNGSFPCDALADVRSTLATVGQLARWLSAMKCGKWRSTDLLPRADVLLYGSIVLLEEIERETKTQLVDRLWERDPSGRELSHDEGSRRRAARLVSKIPPRYWQRLYWDTFCRRLNFSLARFRPFLQIDRATGVPVHYIEPEASKDVLFLALWEQALGENHVGRHCPGCGGVFFLSRTNYKRIYCSSRCKTRVNVRRHRAKSSRAQKIPRPRRARPTTKKDLRK